MPCFGGTFEVNFRPLIQLNSRGLLNSFDGGQPGLSGCIGIIVCLDAEAFKQGRSRFLFTCATLGAVRVATSVLYFVIKACLFMCFDLRFLLEFFPH